MTGRSVLARETIEVLPNDNGSINELLKVLPGVQFGEESRTSYNGGDILPPDVSIAGGKVFQNNFQIDGFANDSYSDPTWEGASSPINLPGHPQTLFLDADLVDAVHLYDHNISAEYGGFTGGVIDARTRDPGPEFGGSLYYRTTRDEWTEFHVDPEREEEFENSRSPFRQPEFEKHDGGLTLNLPLGAGRGLLASYQRLQSSIPLRWLDGEKTDRRLLENFFGKYFQAFPSGDTLRLTLLHAPYEEDRFYPDSMNGEFSLGGDSSTATLSWEHPFDHGILELRGGYRRSESRRGGADYLYVWGKTPSKDWGVEDKSLEGGPGPLRKSQQGWQTAFVLDLDEFGTGALRHQVRLGADRERVDAVLERSEEYVFAFGAEEDDELDCNGVELCIDGEQFLKFRIVHPAGRVGATIDFYGVFLEDRIRFGRLEIRPGLRFSYDDFMRNRNVAPRLAASFDVFGDGGTILIAGRNRYFGKTLMAYKLREMDRSDFQLRFSPVPFGEPEGEMDYRYSRLDTPRTDETVVGVDQLLWGGMARLRYIERDGEKEFAREKENGINILNNDGSSLHRQYRLGWERWWRRHYLAINVTYQETLSSNEDYSETFDYEALLENQNDKVWYDGDVVALSDLPRRDFNRPWIGNLVYSIRLPQGFTFTNFTRYRGAYRALENTGDDILLPDGTELDIYDEVENSDSWLFDWKLSWRRRIGREASVQLDLEVNNVFDREIETGDGGSNVYETGRQFWAGAKLDF